MNSKKDVKLGKTDRLDKKSELSLNAQTFYFYFLQKKSDFDLKTRTFTQNFRNFLLQKFRPKSQNYV